MHASHEYRLHTLDLSTFARLCENWGCVLGRACWHDLLCGARGWGAEDGACIIPPFTVGVRAVCLRDCQLRLIAPPPRPHPSPRTHTAYAKPPTLMKMALLRPCVACCAVPALHSSCTLRRTSRNRPWRDDTHWKGGCVVSAWSGHMIPGTAQCSCSKPALCEGRAAQGIAKEQSRAGQNKAAPGCTYQHG